MIPVAPGETDADASPPFGHEVVAVFGPTGAGKSEVAEELARQVGAEIVSADAMQMYRGVPILTNQSPTPTRLVAVRDLSETMSVGEYARLAHEAIDECVTRDGIVVVAGGTGLYLRAALCELRLPPPAPLGTRERLDALYEELGPAQTHALLAQRDPRAAEVVHENDRRRVVRALELNELGLSLAPDRDRLWSQEMRRTTLLVGIDVQQEELDRRIAERTAMMFARGAAREAQDAGMSSDTARHVIGLREARTLPPDEAIAAITERTRRYARYQRKWMRRLPLAATLDGLASADENARAIRALLGTAA